MIFTKLAGTGSYLPEKVISNVDLEKTLDTSNEWIIERTGIEKRHIIADDQTVTQMGVLAARNALEKAQVDPSEIDLVVAATCSADQVFPATACLIQEALGIQPVPAFDLQAVCTGFLYGLSVVDQFIRTGTVKKALLVGTEAMSRVVDWSDRSTCILFGDGAGAVVLEAASTPGILDTRIQADGRQKDLLYLNDSEQKLKMAGNRVFRCAVNCLQKVSETILADNNLSADQIDWFVPHQANIRIIQATAKKLNLPMEKVILTLQTQGNTSAASVPLALDKGCRSGQIKTGEQILLGAFGGGLTWGAALLRV